MELTQKEHTTFTAALAWQNAGHVATDITGALLPLVWSGTGAHDEHLKSSRGWRVGEEEPGAPPNSLKPQRPQATR